MFLSKKETILLSVITLQTVLSVLYSQSVETVVQTGHYGPVTAVCFSSDGKSIATGSADKTVKLWRVSDGKEIRTFQGTPSEVTKVEINRQGTSVLSVSANGIVSIWDMLTGKVINQIKPGDDNFTCASFNPDGTCFIAGSRKTGISLWEISTGNKKTNINATPVNLSGERSFEYLESKSVSYSADGKYIIAGVSDYTAIVWDVSDLKEIRKYKKTRSTCTSCEIEAVLSPDNKYVITSASDSLKIFNRETGNLVKALFGQGGTPECLNISADGHFVAAIEYGVAEVWDMTTWKQVLKAGDYSARKVESVALSQDGKFIIAGNEKRTADLILVEKNEVSLILKGYLNQIDESILTDSYMYWAAFINEVKLSPDGKFVAVGRTGNNAKLIDFSTGKVYKTLRGHSSLVISLCFSNDGKYLATGGLDGKAIVWDVESGNPVRTIKFPDEKNAIYSVDISADNKYLVTADWGGLVVIWDIATGNRIRAVSPHDRLGCYQVKMLPNNVYFISAGLDRKLKLIEIDTGEEIRSFIGHTDLINSINLAPSGDKFITSSLDETIRIWDIASGLQIRKIYAHKGGAYYARFDPSGNYLISGGDDFLVKLWNASTGELVSSFAGHNGSVGDVNVTSDLKYLISGSRDGSVRIWNVAEKREMISMIFMNENDWFIRNPGGYFDASEGAFNSISFVKGTEIYSISQFFNEFFRPGLYISSLGGETSSFRQNIIQTIEKFPPPTVEFVLPEDGSTSDNQGITCMVRITNNGGGVKEFRVMHNGKRQMVDVSDLQRMSKAGQNTMKTFEVGLIPGENEIAVSAFSNGDIESDQKSIKVIYKGLQKTSDCYLLSIGINKYVNENLNLTYARPDAQAFSSFLSSKSEKLFNKIHIYNLLDSEATKAKILSTLDEMIRVMKKEDVFVFFYAGHGSTEGSVFYFITTEITGLYQQEKLKNALGVNDLQDKFKSLPALKQVVFIDACHSGGSVSTLAMRGASEEKALAQLSRSSGVHVMASSDIEQQSAEIKSLGHGVFTYVLLEALNGKADGAPADSKITIYEIKSYIDDQVPEVSYNLIRHKQFPSTFSIGHDFPLVME